MKKRTLQLVLLAVLAVGCERKNPEPDNTAINERDRADQALTPPDQSQTPDDLKITQQARQALMKDDSLSFSAKNVKIITQDGRVTLRGSVKSAAEKAEINSLV